MRINQQFKLRKVAGEDVLLIQGQVGGEMSKVIAFNETSVLLWNNFVGKDFEVVDVVACLTETFDVDNVTAMQDANDWVQMLQNYGVIQ